MSDESIHYASAADLVRAYQAKTLSPVEVTRHLLDRIAKLDPDLHSYATVTPEIALAQAKAAEQDFAAGRLRGPMHGVPIGIKDLCETKGVLTAWGSRIFNNHIPDADCTVVKRLAQAGTIMLGKTQMTEGAYSVHHPDITPPNNPWNADNWPGVSSSGSGVATAAGLCVSAIGTDTGGSIRFPSGANGLTGIKPTWGRVSRQGVLPLANSLDHVGPMARNAADAGAMLGVMAGADADDPTTVVGAVPDYLEGIASGIKGLRIGIPSTFIFDIAEADTAAVMRESQRVLEDLGASVKDISMPIGTEAMYKDWMKFCAAETAVAHEAFYPSRKSDYGPVLADLIETGRQLSAMDLTRIMHARLVFCGGLRKLFEQCDLLLLPVHPFGNPTASQLDEVFNRPNGIDDVLRFTAPFDMSGSPSITLPGGTSESGLPIGFQLIGRHLDEALLVRAGYAFQSVTHWHDRHPER